MNLLASVLIAASFGGQQNPASILAWLVPNPTGRNGYEEYLHAADIVGPSGWTVYENWLSYKQAASDKATSKIAWDEDAPELPPGVSPEMPDLEVRKVADQRLGVAYEILRLGNEKPVYDPRSDFSYETLLPELARFRMLAKVGANRAHVEFAEGRTKQAVDDLLEGLKFASKISGTTRISYLVAISNQVVDLLEFQEHLGQLTLDDARRIEKECTSLIETRPSVSAIFKNERSGVGSAMNDISQKSAEFLTPEEEKAFGQALKGLSPIDQEQLKSMVAQGLEERVTAEEQRLSGPESGWLVRENTDETPPALNDKSVSNLALLLVQEFVPKSMSQKFAQRMAQGRIRLRLMRLHAKVLEFHWLNNRWPNKIEECADRETAFDPFEQAPFHYERQGDGYRIYSLGIPGLGPIELKYQPMSAGPSTGGSPPPSS